jgi:hypothetical protein
MQYENIKGISDIRDTNVNRIDMKLRYRILDWTKLVWDKFLWHTAVTTMIDLQVPYKKSPFMKKHLKCCLHEENFRSRKYLLSYVKVLLNINIENLLSNRNI